MIAYVAFMYVYGTKLNPCNFLFKNSGGVSGGGSYGAGSGSFSLDINVLDQSVNQNTQIGQSLTEFTIGSESVPLPIHTKVVPIFEALVDNLWDASERTSIRQKKTHLRTALQGYASYKGAAIAQGSCSIIHDYWCVCVCVCVCLWWFVMREWRGKCIHRVQYYVINTTTYIFHYRCTDPSMTVDLHWPAGRYTLIQAASGCPTGWSSGWRLQDNEDNNNENRWSPSNINSYIRIRLGRNLKTYYCTKTSDGTSGFAWPRGKYCIARYGGSCPSGFYKGYIHWDDENSDNINRKHDPVPDGNYDCNTRINFCCRSDGNVNEPMLLLPNNFRIHMSYHTMLLVVIKCTSHLTDIQLMVSSSHQNCKQDKLAVSACVFH